VSAGQTKKGDLVFTGMKMKRYEKRVSNWLPVESVSEEGNRPTTAATGYCQTWHQRKNGKKKKGGKKKKTKKR